jgi:hypothetical protein
VACVSVEDLAVDNERVLHVLAHLIDHYLGADGAPSGLWLSEGGGVSDPWRDAGARLAKLYDLGYAADEVAQANARDYFAQSLALFCRDRRRLNVSDPQIDKWFRTVLWSESYWLSDKHQGE